MNFVKRLISGVFIVIITLAVMRFSDPFFYLFLCLIGTAMAWEWEKMLKNRTSGVAVAMAGAVVVNILYFALYPWIVFAILVLSTLFIYLYLKHKKEEKALFLTLGNLYINFPLIGLAYIVTFFEFSEVYEQAAFFVLLWIFLTVWASDIGGYIFGHAIGGPKLAPIISPKKTWAGFFGGIILAVTVSYIYIYLFPILPAVITGFGIVAEAPKHFNLWFLVFTGITSVVSQVGDLFESFIKRKVEIKDSSNLIPGHGGVFDRYDGLLFVAVFVSLAVYAHWTLLINAG